LDELIDCGRRTKKLAKFLDINLAGIRKILKQLEKKMKRRIIYSISTQYIETRLSIPNSKLNFLRNYDNIYDLMQIYEKSYHIIEKLLFSHGYGIKKAKNFSVYERNECSRLI
jgi:SPX domain protein involved in polyphosphate accumulation